MMKEILIINLTRMGDLLQSTPLMQGLKDKHPDATLTLLANSAFEEICRGIACIDRLILFDMKEFRQRLLDEHISLVDNYILLEAMIDRITDRSYDLTVNITHSPVSAILTHFIQTREIRGFTIDPEGHRVIRHPWVRYSFNVIPNRRYNPFHIVDMYLKIGEVSPEYKTLLYDIPDGMDKEMSGILRAEGVYEGDMIVGFHLGASKSDKRWPVRAYAELAGMIREQYGARILLFGAKQERHLTEEFMSYGHADAVNFAGRTGLGELAALLRHCNLFISNDSGPLHIATSVGTRVLDISAANVNFMETGPYGKGHYVIQADLPCVPCGFDVECNNMICKKALRPQSVFRVVQDMLGHHDEEYDPEDETWTGLQVYRSGFSYDGYLGFIPLVRRPLDRESFYRILYRAVWNYDWSCTSDRTTYQSDEMYRQLSMHDGMKDHARAVKSLLDDCIVLKGLIDIAEEARGLVMSIHQETMGDLPDIGTIKDLWSRAESIEKKIEQTGHAHPCFQPLVIFFCYAREALEGGDVQELSVNLCLVYDDLIKRAGLLQNIIQDAVSFMEKSSEDIVCDRAAT